ncbi:unnamed protein product, partial [Prunus brigantina]
QKKKKDLPIRTVLREAQGGNQKRPLGDIARRKHTSRDARCARNPLRGYLGSYPFPKGGKMVTKHPLRSAARKKGPSVDAGFARIFLREVPIRFLMEVGWSHENVLRETQKTPQNPLRG